MQLRLSLCFAPGGHKKTGGKRPHILTEEVASSKTTSHCGEGEVGGGAKVSRSVYRL